MIKLSAGSLGLGFVCGALAYWVADYMEYDTSLWATDKSGPSRALSKSLIPGLLGVAVAMVAGSFLGIGAQPINLLIGSIAGAVAICYATKPAENS